MCHMRRRIHAIYYTNSQWSFLLRNCTLCSDFNCFIISLVLYHYDYDYIVILVIIVIIIKFTIEVPFEKLYLMQRLQLVV
jgi:hypothetical protein